MIAQGRRNSMFLVIGLALLIALSIGSYLWMSWRVLSLGFPLDDAWIHQSYARNLALRGEWAFLSGQPSAGSTSPLWATALAGGHILGGDPKAWAYGLGTLCLGVVAWLGARWLFLRLSCERLWLGLAAAMMALEWHLVWAAVSGMEVLALGLLATGIFYALERGQWRISLIGALIGLGVWLRPEAVLLTVAAVWVILTRERFHFRTVLVALVELVIGMSVLVIPYLVFNRALSGAWWPTTFYAKQAEYAVLRQASLWRRLIEQAGLPFVGVLVLLLPGIVLGAMSAIRSKQWYRFAPLLWVCSHLGAYALRLPLTYQHGRYAMPTVPVLLVLGLEGFLGWVQLDTKPVFKRVVSRAWLVSVVITAIGFWYLGARAYTQDVAIIQTEMVASADWVRENTAKDALIAAHDIGALGYFADRDILDLAGLVDPTVIPFIRDEQALGELLDERRVDFLMTFPDWYPQLIVNKIQVFSTSGQFSPLAGGENMVVYKWSE